MYRQKVTTRPHIYPSTNQHKLKPTQCINALVADQHLSPALLSMASNTPATATGKFAIERDLLFGNSST
jgi:hypothetical protein